MVEPLEYRSILGKLREKTEAGRVSWRESGKNRFECELDNRYRFVVYKTEDKYGVRMDELQASNFLFYIEAEEEILFGDDNKEEIFNLLADLYELARRNALNVPGKLATVAQLLDNI